MVTQTGFGLEEVGQGLSWSCLASFLKYAKPESALAMELHPEVGEWATTLKTNLILADIFDLLSQMNANVCRSKKKPKPYPRPGDKKKGKLGTAMTMEEYKKRMERRRREHGERRWD